LHTKTLLNINKTGFVHPAKSPSNIYFSTKKYIYNQYSNFFQKNPNQSQNTVAV